MDSDRVAWTRSRSIRVWELRVRISTRRRARGPGRAGETGNKTARGKLAGSEYSIATQDDARMISGNAKDTTRQNNKIKTRYKRNGGTELRTRIRVTRGTRALPPHGIAGFDAHEAPTRNQITDFWVDRGLERDRMDARTPS
ncbi:hypothetical protein DFP72DRAFT_858426 [Ephemerocybe angulata]|uniref:Uncharacterized protein n=1 Tax=Ephemerocybe angulata TaxID=980116 RepID=A0A8H6HB89_9AGAR|nr:hypothetical protein DFP72DRAFT_858426 [Tulosesus angulatus]